MGYCIKIYSTHNIMLQIHLLKKKKKRHSGIVAPHSLSLRGWIAHWARAQRLSVCVIAKQRRLEFYFRRTERINRDLCIPYINLIILCALDFESDIYIFQKIICDFYWLRMLFRSLLTR